MSQLYYSQSPVLYPTVSEINFDTFIHLKQREEKLIQIFFDYYMKDMKIWLSK